MLIKSARNCCACESSASVPVPTFVWLCRTRLIGTSNPPHQAFAIEGSGNAPIGQERSQSNGTIGATGPPQTSGTPGTSRKTRARRPARQDGSAGKTGTAGQARRSGAARRARSGRTTALDRTVHPLAELVVLGL